MQIACLDCGPFQKWAFSYTRPVRTKNRIQNTNTCRMRGKCFGACMGVPLVCIKNEIPVPVPVTNEKRTCIYLQPVPQSREGQPFLDGGGGFPQAQGSPSHCTKSCRVRHGECATTYHTELVLTADGNPACRGGCQMRLALDQSFMILLRQDNLPHFDH